MILLENSFSQQYFAGVSKLGPEHKKSSMT